MGNSGPYFTERLFKEKAKYGKCLSQGGDEGAYQITFSDDACVSGRSNEKGE